MGVTTPYQRGYKGRHAIVNVRNTDDNKCFLWAIRSALYPVEQNPERPSKYPTDDLDWSGVEFPVPITGIDEFEENNNLAINVYGEREQTIVPLRISKSAGDKNTPVLLWRTLFLGKEPQ